MSDDWSDAARVITTSDAVQCVLDDSNLDTQDRLLACLYVFGQDVHDGRLTRKKLMRMLDAVLEGLQQADKIAGTTGGRA